MKRDRPLERQHYLDPHVFERERALFRASWVCVGHASELVRPGAFVVAEVAGSRLVVVRGADLALRAFYDGCLHRRATLVDAPEGCLAELALRCPYHGLRYSLDGRVDPEACGHLGLSASATLPSVRLEERWGFLFVCLEPSAPAFDAANGPAPSWLDRAEVPALRLGRRSVHEVAANWKICVQNFQESHHFAWVHRGLERATPWRASTSIDLGGRFLGGTMELAPGFATVSEDGALHDRPIVAHPDDRGTVWDAHLFPLWLTSLQPDYFLSYRLTPRSARVTTIVADIYFHQAAFKPGFQPDDVFAFWARTNAEDHRICERVQLGLEGAPFEQGPYAEVEDGVRSFDRLWRRAFTATQPKRARRDA